MWNSVEELLLEKSKDVDARKNRGTVKGLLVRMGSFEFVFFGKLLLKILGEADPVAKILQAKDQNMGTDVRMIEALKKQLQKYREDGWANLLKEVIDFCVKKKIEVPYMEEIIPCRIRTLVDRVPMTYFHHFSIEIFTKVIDEVADELNNCFTETNTYLLKGITFLDPSNSFAYFDHAQIMHLAGLYSEDFSSSEIVELHYQLESYISAMRADVEFTNLDDVGALARKMVQRKYHNCFPLVYRLIELVLVLPVGTATVERCFSAMNVVKTHLRNRLGDELLSDCLLCYIEKKIFLSMDEEAILQCFQKMASRKNYLKPNKSLLASNRASPSVTKKTNS